MPQTRMDGGSIKHLTNQDLQTSFREKLVVLYHFLNRKE
jgi:hypothetical protein